MICIKQAAQKCRVDEIFYFIGKVIFIPLFLLGIWFSQGGFEKYSQLLECSLRRLSGLPCPGCGGTRAFYHLFRGEIIESIRLNPIVFYGIAAYIHFMSLFAYRKHTGRMQEKEIPIQYYLYGAAVILILQWIIKIIHIFYIQYSIA